MGSTVAFAGGVLLGGLVGFLAAALFAAEKDS